MTIRPRNGLAIVWLLLAVSPVCGGSFSGRMFNLDGQPLDKTDTVKITAFALDQDNGAGRQLVINEAQGNRLVLTVTGSSFSFTIDDSQLSGAPTNAVQLNFERNGFRTRTLNGLLGASSVVGASQTLDVTVPKEPPSCDRCGAKETCSVRAQPAMIVGKYARVVSPTAALKVGDDVVGVVPSESLLPVRRVENGWVWTSTVIGQREVKGWIWSGDLARVDEVVQFQPVEPVENKDKAVVVGNK